MCVGRWKCTRWRRIHAKRSFRGGPFRAHALDRGNGLEGHAYSRFSNLLLHSAYSCTPAHMGKESASGFGKDVQGDGAETTNPPRLLMTP